MVDRKFDLSKLPEISLAEFLIRAKRYAWLYLVSVIFFGSLAYLYLWSTPPSYEVKSTLLLDQNGRSRSLGESKLVEGSIGFETEKNIFNEINILSSNKLIRKTIEDLDFRVSYFSKQFLRKRELSETHPFRIKLLDGHNQVINQPIFIEKISSQKYRIILTADEFNISTFPSGLKTKVDQPLHLVNEYVLGDTIQLPYLGLVVTASPFWNLLDSSNTSYFFQIHDPQDLATAYREKLGVLQVDLQSSILELSTKGEIPNKSIQFLDQLASNYINSKIEERNQIASKKEDFIRSQLLGVAEDLNRAERNIEVFRRTTNSVDLSRTGSQALEEIQSLQSEESKINLNLKYYNSLLTYIEDTSSINKIIAPSVVGIEDPLLNQNLVEFKRLTSEKTKLEYTKGSQSLDLKIISAQIQDTKESLVENIRNLINSTQLILSDIQRRMRGVESTINRLPGSEKKLVSYERKSKLYENLYNYLSQELAKTGIARAEDFPDIIVLDEARMEGDGPIAPQTKLIAILAILLGLIFPTAFLAFKSNRNDPIHSASALEQRTYLPLISKIAFDRKLKNDPLNQRASWMIEESFRDLDANIKFLHPRQRKTVLAITSMCPGEGKTFASLNLARGMASAGKRVLLVDVDFRSPSLSNIIGLDEKYTFDGYLSGRVENFEPAIQTDHQYESLDYLMSQPTNGNPHRLIQNARFEYLILTLKDQYDYVILDCPAVGIVSDYLLMSHFIDIHLFLLRVGHSKFSFVEEIQKLKLSGKIENAYLVLNGVSKKSINRGNYDYRSFEKVTSANKEVNVPI